MNKLTFMCNNDGAPWNLLINSLVVKSLYLIIFLQSKHTVQYIFHHVAQVERSR